MGENLKAVQVDFSTLSWAVFLYSNVIVQGVLGEETAYDIYNMTIPIKTYNDFTYINKCNITYMSVTVISKVIYK